MIGGWRARLYYWSRHSGALKKAALWIAGAGFVSAWLYAVLAPDRRPAAMVDPVEQGIRNDGQRLRHATEARPRELSLWLRRLLPRVHHLCDIAGIDYPTRESFQTDGKLANFDVRPLVQKHAGDAEAVRMFEDFVQAFLAEEGDVEDLRRVRERAERAAPPALANELHGALLVRARRDEAALIAFVREGQLFADAKTAREDALRLALKLKDAETVRVLVETPGWLAGAPPLLQYEAGTLLNDGWLIGKGLVRHRVTHLPVPQVLQALFAAGLWYVILVLQSVPRPWRWWLPFLPIAAGMVSVWPTLWIGAWQETTLQMTEEAPFPHDLWYWVMGVGLREEVAKLGLFALFLPWLLWRRAPGLALMTGAFVGLGFAIEENVSYYERYGGAVALTRFLTANFLHAALSGMAGHALYDMLRSRFARADKFVATFFAVVAVHGIYDYAASSDVDGMGYLTMALLAFTAWHFLDLVAHEAPGARQLVAPAAVFLIGIAILIATVFWLSAVQSGSVKGLYAAAAECLMIAPLCFIYWRRLD